MRGFNVVYIPTSRTVKQNFKHFKSKQYTVIVYTLALLLASGSVDVDCIGWICDILDHNVALTIPPQPASITGSLDHEVAVDHGDDVKK